MQQAYLVASGGSGGSVSGSIRKDNHTTWTSWSMLMQQEADGYCTRAVQTHGPLVAMRVRRSGEEQQLHSSCLPGPCTITGPFDVWLQYSAHHPDRCNNANTQDITLTTATMPHLHS